MRFILILLLVLISGSFSLFGQLSASQKKLIGIWKYSGGSGFEVWNQQDDQLHGFAYRMSKIGDTSKVEEISLKRVNKRLVYSIKTFKHTNDSTVILQDNFIGGKSKMKFYNLESSTPYLIEYRFNFLSRNKLKIKIQYGPNDEPLVLSLLRIKD